MSEKENKFNNYKRKLIEGRIHVPYNLGFSGSGLREGAVIDYYENFNEHIDYILSQEEIPDEEVLHILII